jgi:hypothetical protein
LGCHGVLSSHKSSRGQCSGSACKLSKTCGIHRGFGLKIATISRFRKSAWRPDSEQDSNSFHAEYMLLRINTCRCFLVSSTLEFQRTITISHLIYRPHQGNTTTAPQSDFNRPAPPRLPKHLQEEFENLQRQAEATPTGNMTEDGTELHPDMRRPAQAEFTGDRHPVTGEVGGPKVEPTRHGDWSYGGRTSDF